MFLALFFNKQATFSISEPILQNFCIVPLYIIPNYVRQSRTKFGACGKDFLASPQTHLSYENIDAFTC